MANILDAVDSLCLASQNRLIDHGFIRCAGYMGQQRVELPRAQNLAARQFRADRIGKVAQRVHLFRVGLVVNAEHAGAHGLCQCLRRRDIGRDHVVLDQALRVALRPLDDRVRHPVFIKKHTPFLEVQRQWLTRLPRRVERPPGSEQVGNDAVLQRDAGLVMSPFVPCLNLIIGQPCCRADQRPFKPVRDHLAAVIEDHFRDHRRAWLFWSKRAQIIRQRLGEHRHNAVGQIDRVAAPFCFSVQGRAGADVIRHIGNRDADHPATAFPRFGKHRIIEIAGIGTIDGDKRKIAKIGPSVRRRHLHAVCFGKNGVIEIMRNLEFGKGQRGKGTGRIRRAEIVDDTRRLAKIAASRQQFRLDKITLAAGDIAVLFHHDRVARAAGRLLQDQSAAPRNNGAEQAALYRFQNANDLAVIACAADPAKPRQHLLTGTRGPATASFRKNPDGGRGAIRLDRGHRQQRAIPVNLADDDHGDFGQRLGRGDPAAGLPGDRAAFRQ